MGDARDRIMMALVMLMMVQSATAIIDVPGMPSDPLVRPGNLTIAAIIPVHHYSYTAPCGSSIRGVGAMQHVRAVGEAVGMVNANPDILKNLTLGYVLLDDCGSDTTALAHSIRSLSRRSGEAPEPFYDVFGIVGPFHSSGSLLVGRYSEVIKLPLVSPTATNDDLSDGEKYKYFFRVVPPDKYQAQAMIELVTYFNWSYVSTVNSEGVYGRNGIKHVHDLAEKSGICVAVSKELKFGDTEQDFDIAVESLLRYESARVLLLFVNEVEGVGLLRALDRAGVMGKFVLIFSDTFNQYHHVAGFEHVALGAFAVDLYTRKQPQETRERFVDPGLYNNNHFYDEFWRTYYNCSPIDFTNNCSDVSRFALDTYVPLIMDSVFTLAYAAHALIEDHCPGKSCLREHNILPYIKNTSFNGTSEHIRFNHDGDILARYRFKHLRKEDSKEGSGGAAYSFGYIGGWDMADNAVRLDESLLQWPDDSDNGITSVCSLPCLPGHYIVYSEVVCCWECHPCHPTEITHANASTCQRCPVLEWPDPLTKSYCERIPPSYIQIQHFAVLPIFITGLLGVALVVVTQGFFIRYRRNKLIKATSRELSHTMLASMLLSNLVVLIMLQYPSDVLCALQYYGFNISFTLLYAPLLTKVNRVHRLFNRSGVNGTQRPAWTSTRASITITSLLVLVQFVVITVTNILHPSHAQLHMPVITEKFVELFCDTTMAGFVVPLCYNLLLILACTVLGYKSRALPDNFNDSKYIFLCGCATVFLWLVLLPTYFAVFYAQHKVILLCLALLLNTGVFLCTLFLPKVYAVVCLPEAQLNIKAGTGIGPASVNSRSTGGVAKAGGTGVTFVQPMASSFHQAS